MAKEMDEELGDAGATNASIRQAKKAARPGKIGEAQPPPPPGNKGRSKAKRKAVGRLTSSKLGAFKSELGEKRPSGAVSREGMRARKGDVVSLSAKNKNRSSKSGKHTKGRK